MALNIDYELDVEGDVILILQSPNEPFAFWADEVEAWELPRSPPPVLEDHLAEIYRRMDHALQDDPIVDEPPSFGWDGVQEEDPLPEPADASPDSELPESEPPENEEAGMQAHLSNPNVEETSDLSGISEMERPKQMGPEDDEIISHETSQVRFRLSSRHLISASPYFRAMLTRPWEKNTLRDISTAGWDADALKLLMDIIHGSSQNVPRSIELELLAKVAVLVDYYKCYDVVKFYSDTWLEGFDGFPESHDYSRDSVLILFVSCVFFQSDTFRDFTHSAIQYTQGPIRSLDLPFPDGVIEEIERNRADAIGRLLDGFHSLLQYFSTRDHCHFECNAILVGSLYREMFAQGFINPRPAGPFHGFSVEKALQMARDISSPKGSDTGVCGARCYRPSSTCSVQKFLDPLIDQVTDSLEGLELEEYVANPWTE